MYRFPSGRWCGWPTPSDFYGTVLTEAAYLRL